MGNEFLVGVLVITPLFIIVAFIWGYRIKKTNGNKRLESICCMLQTLGFILTMFTLFGIGLAVFGERGGVVGFLLLIFTMVSSIYFGPTLGNKVFVHFTKNTIGEVRAEQICRHAKF